LNTNTSTKHEAIDPPTNAINAMVSSIRFFGL